MFDTVLNQPQKETGHNHKHMSKWEREKSGGERGRQAISLSLHRQVLAETLV